MRVLISGWSGSTNLGDELVLAGLLRLLAGHDVSVVSVDPVATRARFGVRGVRPRDTTRLLRAVREADLVVFGGGGLLQDETSPFNLPYHLARPALAMAAGTPVVGVGLGAGPLTRAGSRSAVRLLNRAAGVSVRDPASRRLLADCGVPAGLGTDLALALDPPDVEIEDVITVSLRPWAGGGGWLPVGARGRARLADDVVAALATGLDALAASTGLTVRFVALQSDRDDEVHARVAARMRAPAQRRLPDVGHVVDEVAAGRLVVAMRYHAGVAAVLGGRPAVLLGYSPKVDALAAELGPGGRLLGWRADDVAGGLVTAGSDVLDHHGAVAATRERLRGRLAVDRAVLGRVLDVAPPGHGAGAHD